ncbi:ricin-type beta-trefoil lectin domain protein [Streptomyces sp. TRM 70361]|uniref:ricin-type beta-trefoil lectin domain protein n=1 Tax=Streptomyces sp. TRM 70361 TaxID=3116553 RepID=UPI002E7AEF48|nr:ricin-type beta-trefoil lectin domain protein [Streptomyces sp. TRM 70361]MEE1943078.1 ricin-type beta-trefoil lectin domain protein [Streptomyces sp. TRM 70361]
MGRERKYKGTDAQNALARYLVELTGRLGLDTVDKVAKRFSGSRSMWAEYLNGGKLIPKPVLGEVLHELRRTRSDSWSDRVLVEANKLWKAAAEGTAPPQDSLGTELVSLHRRLDETTQALVKAQTVAARSERVILMLLQFSGWQERKVARLTREVEHLHDKERAESAQRLEQAQLRLARVQVELERARSDRFTAEQAQAVLLRERQEALEDISRLQQTAADPAPIDAEPTLLPRYAPEPSMSDEEIDRGMDEQLDLISTDRAHRGVLLSEVVEQAGLEPRAQDDNSRTIPGTVVAKHTPAPDTPDAAPLSAPLRTTTELSRTTPDNPATSNNGPTRSPGAPGRRFKARHKIALAGLALAVAGLAAPFVIRSLHDTDANASLGSSTGSAQPSSTASAPGSSTADKRGSAASAPGSSTADKRGSAEKPKGPAEASGKPLVEPPETPANTASSKPLTESAFGLITVTNPDNGTTMCVDNDTNKGQNGDVVQLWDCDYSGQTAGQLWTLHSDNTLRVWGKCLDIVDNNFRNHARLQLWDCNGSGGQQWTHTADNELKNPQSGLCLDDPKARMDKGTNLEIYRCLGDVWTQQWHFVNPAA